MKIRTILLLVIVLIAAQSCTIFSLHPLYLEGELIKDSKLVGTWKQTDDEAWVIFEETKYDYYTFRYIEEQDDNQGVITYDSLSFEAGMVKIGEHYFLDLYPLYEDYDEAHYLLRNFVPAHSFIKIELETDKMQVYMFSYDRMKSLFEENKIRIKHEMLDDFIVITAATEDLKKFFEKYADDKMAFDDPGSFIRVK